MGDELLSLPPDDLTSKLISRDREMVRLRNSSPFCLCEGVDFRDYKMRIRIKSCGEKNRRTRPGGCSDAARILMSDKKRLRTGWLERGEQRLA